MRFGAGVGHFLLREELWLGLAGGALILSGRAGAQERLTLGASGLGLTALAILGALASGLGDLAAGAALLCGALTLGLAAALRRGEAWHWRTLSGVGLVASGIGALLALIGAAEPEQGRSSVLALAIVAATLSGAAGLRREAACLDAGFVSALAAFALFLFDRIGFGPDRLDWFLLPLGIYLLLIAEARRQRSLRLPGVLLTLGPSLLAAYLTPSQWSHSLLLAAECLAVIALGIGRRTRAYLGGGIVFLVGLLIVRLWDPLREINYGVYLTLLGVGTLAAAIAFERRREALLAWARAAREKYEQWQ